MEKNEFIEKAVLVHGDRYDYSLVSSVNYKTKVKIICTEHGLFEQLFSKHLNGQNCPECAKIIRGEVFTKNKINKKFEGLKQPEDYKLIPLTKGKFAKVDNEDFDRVKEICWRYSCGYAGSFDIQMHRFIMNTPKGMHTDHINHDTLDNRKSNLRICTHQENLMNQSNQMFKTSKYKGVFWDKARCKWRAEIVFNNKSIYLGRFENEINAAMSYNKKAIELFGEFANVNVL